MVANEDNLSGPRVQRIFERGIIEADVRSVLMQGEEIAAYPDDNPYPSRLLLGWRGGRLAHVVSAYNVEAELRRCSESLSEAGAQVEIRRYAAVA